jgi:hypothetical protein
MIYSRFYYPAEQEPEYRRRRRRRKRSHTAERSP